MPRGLLLQARARLCLVDEQVADGFEELVNGFRSAVCRAVLQELVQQRRRGPQNEFGLLLFLLVERGSDELTDRGGQPLERDTDELSLSVD